MSIIKSQNRIVNKNPITTQIIKQITDITINNIQTQLCQFIKATQITITIIKLKDYTNTKTQLIVITI